MATYAKTILSGSTNGRGIKVVQTSTPGTLLHTAVSGASNFDEIWLYLTNTQAGAAKVTIEWGGVSSPDDTIELTIQGEAGLYLAVPGLILQNGVEVRAFADTGNVVIAEGFVNRITG